MLFQNPSMHSKDMQQTHTRGWMWLMISRGMALTWNGWRTDWWIDGCSVQSGVKKVHNSNCLAVPFQILQKFLVGFSNIILTSPIFHSEARGKLQGGTIVLSLNYLQCRFDIFNTVFRQLSKSKKKYLQLTESLLIYQWNQVQISVYQVTVIQFSLKYKTLCTLINYIFTSHNSEQARPFVK